MSGLRIGWGKRCRRRLYLGLGLSVAELFDIIEYIARDDLDEFFTKSDTKKTIMTPQKHGAESVEDSNTFNHSTKVALVRALDSLGVVSTNGDIWMPLSEVHTRREVRNRYMKGERGEYILSLTSDGIYTEDLEHIPSPTVRWRHHLIRFSSAYPRARGKYKRFRITLKELAGGKA